jgi:hypothetical protein
MFIHMLHLRLTFLIANCIVSRTVYAIKTRVLDGLCKYCDNPPLPKYVRKSRVSASVDCDVAGRYAPPLPPDPARLAICWSVRPEPLAYTDVARKGLCMWLALVIRLCCDRLKNC